MASPEPDETISAQDAAPDPQAQHDPNDDHEGADVARDPDVIQREIEQTRAELAETIDAIADRVSPKRAASRGVSAVKSQVSSILDRGGDDADTAPPSSVLDAGTAAAGPAQIDTGPASHYTGTTQYDISRSLRTDRVLIVAGVAAAVAAIIVLRRRSR